MSEIPIIGLNPMANSKATVTATNDDSKRRRRSRRSSKRKSMERSSLIAKRRNDDTDDTETTATTTTTTGGEDEEEEEDDDESSTSCNYLSATVAIQSHFRGKLIRNHIKLSNSLLIPSGSAITHLLWGEVSTNNDNINPMLISASVGGDISIIQITNNNSSNKIKNTNSNRMRRSMRKRNTINEDDEDDDEENNEINRNRLILLKEIHCESEINGIKYHSNSKRIITGHNDGVVRLWDVENCINLQEMKCNSDINIKCISHDITFNNISIICCGDNRGCLWLLDPRQKRSIIKEFKEHNDGINDIKIIDNTIMSGGKDNLCILYDIRKYETKHILRQHQNSVTIIENDIYNKKYII